MKYKKICIACHKEYFGDKASKYCDECRHTQYNIKRREARARNSIKKKIKKHKKCINLTVKQWEDLSAKLDKMGISYGQAVGKGLI